MWKSLADFRESTMHGNDPAVRLTLVLGCYVLFILHPPKILEREKLKNLAHQTASVLTSAPGWNEKLASASEAAVKVRTGINGPFSKCFFLANFPHIRLTANRALLITSSRGQ
jgi:hypothetical protein